MNVKTRCNMEVGDCSDVDRRCREMEQRVDSGSVGLAQDEPLTRNKEQRGMRLTQGRISGFGYRYRIHSDRKK